MDPKLLSLAPTDALDPHKDPDFQAYHDHLTAVFDDDSLRNIAMIGNRGSGKSSILRSFDARRHKGHQRFLYISLADFEGSAEQTKEEPEQTQKRLEYSLLCQILARCTADDLKNSTLRGIPEVRKNENRFWRYAWFLLTGLLIFGLLFEDRFGALLIGWGVPGIWRVGLHALGYVAAFLSLAGGFLWLRRKRPELVHIGKLTIKTPNADAELTPGSDKYCLDQFKFELICILNQISEKIGCTVVFEDMERLDSRVSIQIMTRLRELNALTNTHRKCQDLEGHIRFVYALSDELFGHEERTKFFDTIVPVVPVVNAVNSRKMLEIMLQDLGVLAIHPQMQELLEIVSPCLTDYRTTRNVITEFQFLCSRFRVNYGQFADLEICTRLLAVCVYKSLFPKEFHRAFATDAVLKLPEASEYPASFVTMAERLIARNWLDFYTMELLGYSPNEIEMKWQNILLSGDTQSIYSLLFHFNDYQIRHTPEGDRFLNQLRMAVWHHGMLKSLKDPGLASIIGSLLFADAKESLAEFVLQTSSPDHLEPAEFINWLAMLPVFRPDALQEAIDDYNASAGPHALANHCIEYLERLNLCSLQYVRSEDSPTVVMFVHRPWTTGNHITALCMLLGDQRSDLPGHLLEKKIGEKTLREHIAEFNEKHPQPTEEPTPT